ncbi:brefeldin A-inhibited guanine nucleotide-exchange protein 3-like isoform X1 [Clavelina lepadiformis]|uniref:brefeldin A-inhibited guanine nucleotide-exchange protein 3-like isoform X1 n=1 Tax=Clavelina lepadiformis TaxID=159417 RepID=UPI00404326B4
MANFSMEQHLHNLFKSTTALRYRYIHDHVQLTLDTLDTQKVSYAFKAWQIREKCLSVMKQALESNNPHLSSTALHGIEHVVFHPDLGGYAGDEELDAMDARIFALQVLNSLTCLPSLSDEQQVHGLKILLGLCCDFISSFDGELIIKIVQLCLACWHKDKINVHSALLQLCAAYTLHIQKLCAATCSRSQVDVGVHCAAESLASQAVEKLAKADVNGSVTQEKLADVTGLAKFFVQQVILSSSDTERAVHLECLLAVFKTLKSSYIRCDTMFCNYIRKDLCPALVSLISKQKGGHLSHVVSKKGSKRKHKRIHLSCPLLHKKVSFLLVELVRLVGCVASLQSDLLMVTTCLLSPASCPDHAALFVTLKQLWATPESLFNLAGPFVIGHTKGKQNRANLIHLVFEAMFSSIRMKRNSLLQIAVMQSAINACTIFMQVLNEMRLGLGLTEEQIALQINSDDEDSFSDGSLSDDEKTSLESEQVGMNADCTEGNIRQQSCLEGNNTSDKQESEYLSDAEDIWASSEDIFSSISSPCYQSAAEDPEDFNDDGLEQAKASKLSDLLQYLLNTAKSTFSQRQSDDRSSFNSTYTASDPENQDAETDHDIDKYLEDVIVSKHPLHSRNILVNSAEDEKNCVLAQRHIQSIVEILPDLLSCHDVATVDQIIQNAASHFCSDMYEIWNVGKIFVQADSLYKLSYAVMVLCMRLKLNCHYMEDGSQLPCVKSQWVGYQQCSGVYLSKSWLSETFRLVISTDLLGNAGYDAASSPEIPCLITVLTEIDGLGYGGVQHLHDVKPPSMSFDDFNFASQAGFESAKQIASLVWGRLLQILQYPLKYIQVSSTGTSSDHPLTTSTFLQAESTCEQQCIMSALDGLRLAFKLSCTLDLHEYSQEIFTQIIAACVPKIYSLTFTPLRIGSGVMHEMNLHRCHVLCMDSVLEGSLEIANLTSNNWEALFKLVSYVAYLEHVCLPGVKLKGTSTGPTDHICPVTALQDIASLVEDNLNDSSWKDSSCRNSEMLNAGFLTKERTVQAIYSLSNKVDGIFEKAALHLNLRALSDFIWQLCVSSNSQLFPAQPTSENQYGIPLLCRLGKCIMICIRSSHRPLQHISDIWMYASPHFAKVAGHKNVEIAKQSVAFIRDAITSVLTCLDDPNDRYPMLMWTMKEPKYFHFCEALLKPFERAIQTETCVPEIQHSITSAIIMIMEKNSKQICSGWKPLFGCLRHLSTNNSINPAEPNSALHMMWNIYFSACDDGSVFASSACDAVKCLLKIISNVDDNLHDDPANMKPFFSYLEQCALELIKSHMSEYDGKFVYSHRINITPSCTGDMSFWESLTFPMWVTGENRLVKEVVNQLCNMTAKSFSDKDPTDLEAVAAMPTVDFSDDTGSLHVLFLLIDGLTNIVLTSPQCIQTHVLDLMCKLIERCWQSPGPMFCGHMLLHSCLPVLYTWLNRLILLSNDSPLSVYELSAMITSYKHFYGTLMELTTTFLLRELKNLSRCHQLEKKPSNYSLIKEQLELIWTVYLNICISCVQTHKEPLAKLGCSCLRHVIANLGSHMTSSMINDICRCISYMADECLATLKYLVTSFRENDKFLNKLKITVKHHDTAFCDSACLMKAFQATSTSLKDVNNPDIYIFFNSSHHNRIMRISVCELACDILSLHLLHKCIEQMLLGNEMSPWQPPCANSMADSGNNSGSSFLHSNVHADKSLSKNTGSTNIRLLEFLTQAQVHNLAGCVAKAYVVSHNFDQNSELQKLITKVANFFNTANLYQFGSASFELYVKISLAVCCQFPTDGAEVTNTARPAEEDNSHRPTGTWLDYEQLHPVYLERIEDDLKPPGKYRASQMWAVKSLSNSLELLCQRWHNEDRSEFSPKSSELNPAVSELSNCVSSTTIPAAKPEAKQDQQPTKFQYNYMDYVNKTEPSSPAGFSPHKPNDRSFNPQKKKMWADKAAGIRTIGRLVSAYKRHRLSQSNPAAKNQETGKMTDNGKARRYSDTSSGHSLVAADDKSVEREVWAHVVRSTLIMLTNAPDNSLEKLLPIIYRPLASLGNQPPLYYVKTGDYDIGEAFHQWLLRVGDFCHILMPTHSEDQSNQV